MSAAHELCEPHEQSAHERSAHGGRGLAAEIRNRAHEHDLGTKRS